MKTRVVFMGTPEFALPSLQVLIEDYQLVGVVTQPDRPRGRGRKVQPSPVAALALDHDLPVLRPYSIQEPETWSQLQAWEPELIVVAAFGQILPPELLDLPPAACVNVHASLLPRWRGAAPIVAAILAGDETAGVTLMKMDEGLDTGPMLAQASLRVNPDDTQTSLSQRLSQLGAELLSQRLPDWLAGKITPQDQDESLACFAPQIKKEQGQVDWNQPAEQIARQVRAFCPWPGSYTHWQGQPFKILQAIPLPAGPLQGLGPLDQQNGGMAPGTVIAGPSGPEIVTGQGLLLLLEVQPAGKRPMSAPDFARGARGFVGERLG